MTSFEKFQRFLITILIAITFFYGGYYVGKRGYVIELKKNPPSVEIINRYPGDKKVDFALFWQVWDLLNQSYLDRPIDAQKMVYGAISGMVSSLGDPYTSFLDPQVNKAMGDALNGTYEGIGAELGLKDGSLIVIAPLDGSPAKAIGIKAGDKILEIDGKSTVGFTISDAVSKIRGKAGTSINLTIQTDDQAPRKLDIKRENITMASVTWADKGDGGAYIRISRFGGDTNKEWTKAVSEINLKMKQLDSVVIDVRGNPGGYLQSAVYIGEEFVTSGPIVYEETPTGEQIPLPDKISRVGAFTKVPGVFVLIDEGSASASEILAGALKAKVKATLIGKKSFGKGTIQDAKDFSDGSGVHITIAKWLTPDKIWVHNAEGGTKGIEPDIKVEITEENVKNNKDPQLEKAIELAKKI